jgi:hypothetical protein
MKASHNTFQVDAPLTTLLPAGGWSFPVYDTSNCRAIELDIAQYGGAGPGRHMQWSVQHDGTYDLHNRQLSQFLAELRGWSLANPGHDVVTVLLCLKGVADLGGFAAELDTYVGEFLCGGDLSRLYLPRELLDGSPDLRTAARERGWPTLAGLRGRFLLVMTGDESFLDTYAAAPAIRLGFACVDCADDERPPAEYIAGKPNQLFLNYHLFGDHRSRWAPNLSAVRADPSILLRGYLVQDDWWDVAVAAGLNMLATDRVSHPWPLAFIAR